MIPGSVVHRRGLTVGVGPTHYTQSSSLGSNMAPLIIDSSGLRRRRSLPRSSATRVSPSFSQGHNRPPALQTQWGKHSLMKGLQLNDPSSTPSTSAAPQRAPGYSFRTSASGPTDIESPPRDLTAVYNPSAPLLTASDGHSHPFA